MPRPAEATTVFPLSDKLTTYKATKLDVGVIGVPEIQDGARTTWLPSRP